MLGIHNKNNYILELRRISKRFGGTIALFEESAIFPAEVAKKSLAIVQVGSTGINDRASCSTRRTTKFSAKKREVMLM